MTSTETDSNIFKEASTDPASLKEQLLGPDYPYYKYVKHQIK